jgi:voltage-dependent potassium channel beta subunit
MEYRRLGGSGLQVSALSLGAWITIGGQIGEEATLECMRTAREAGVNFFDNAEAYAHGNAETVMGKAIRRLGWKRSDVVVSTKLFWGGHGPNDLGLSRKHLREGTEASLARLGLDYVDLLFCHRPDPRTPIEETVRAMSWLVDRGWTLYWGTSEWDARQVQAAYAIARQEHLVPPQMEQPQYNMFHRARVEIELAPLYREIGLGTTIWSPLASGLLTGKYNDGIPPGSRLGLPGLEWLRDSVLGDAASAKALIAKVRRLGEIAREMNCTTAQLALAWCLRLPEVSSVITGASRAEQVAENMKALDLVPRLTPEVLERIETTLENRPPEPADYR